MTKIKVKWPLSDGDWHYNSRYSQDWRNKPTVKVILWDEQTSYKAGKNGLFHMADVKDHISRRGRKFFFFSYYMKSCLFKDVYSKMFPVLPVLLFDL